MTITELLKFTTPAEQGQIAVILDDTADLSDDAAFDFARDSIYSETDMDFSAAGRLAYNLIHECKRIW